LPAEISGVRKSCTRIDDVWGVRARDEPFRAACTQGVLMAEWLDRELQVLGMQRRREVGVGMPRQAHGVSGGRRKSGKGVEDDRVQSE